MNLVLHILAVLGFTLPLQISHNQSVELTYIANAGFLLEVNNKRVIIDALFTEGFGVYDIPDGTTLNNIFLGNEPFNNINLMLITHEHPDHFNDSLVALYLISNKNNQVVVPPLVYRALQKNSHYETFKNQITRVGGEGVGATVNFKIDEISVTEFRLPHGNRYDIENMGYLIEIDGMKIFHSGDNACAKYYGENRFKLNEEEIDIALLFYYGFWRTEEERKNTKEHLNPKKIVLMHLPFNEVKTIKEDIKMIDHFIDIHLLERSMQNLFDKNN